MPTREQLGVALYFIVPGLILLWARGKFVSNRRQPFADVVTSYVTLSLLYQACIYPFALLRADAAMLTSTLYWIISLFVGPAVVGFLLGLDARIGWSRAILGRLGVNIGHPIDTAWDWRFAGCDPCWVLVVLKDGTKWLGHLGDGSFLSTDPGERDLYIDSVYQADKNDVWTPKGSSVWIAGGEAQSIEFWLKTEDAND